MDHRVALLKEFYGGLPQDRAKLETYRHGFDFLERTLADGVRLEYGELTGSRLLHKYKLTHIPVHRMDGMLQEHVEKTCNVCLYFGSPQSSLFCFNLDHNQLAAEIPTPPEIEFTARALRAQLAGLGCELLVIASGRGYHLWGRLSAPVTNERLYEFMHRAGLRALEQLREQAGSDHRKVKFNLYPNPRTHDMFSLRLFGSAHVKSRAFSRLLVGEELLEEAPSWVQFERHLQGGTIAPATLAAASQALAPAGARPAPGGRSLLSAGLAKWARSIQKSP